MVEQERVLIANVTNRNQVMHIKLGLVNCQDFVCDRKKFMFNAFINLKTSRDI